MPTNEIVLQLRAQYDVGLRSFKNESCVNEVLFQNLILFATGGLEIFYEAFLDSERFQLLQVEVDKQEIFYNVLRRYDLI